MTTCNISDIYTKNAHGRNWTSADSAQVRDFGDCARVTLEWDDGASLYFLTDSKAQAHAELARLGFAPSKAAA